MNIGQTIFHNLKQKYKQKDRKFKIAFCPYKVEMWDSMETIWEEAFADIEQTETTIIPLPYFEKKDNVPYRINHEFSKAYKKNFPERLNEKWDCIVINNPYDALNSLTQTLLYSNELKPFCKNLVYIPYFVPYANPLPDTHILTKGVMNADLVVVDSETTRQDYINALYKFDPHFIEEKIVAWGSPKFDFMTKKIYTPTEWKEKAENRHVILYQTSLIPFYRNPEGKIQQIESTIERYANNDKVCLIWRPHPLYEVVLKKYPMLYNRYDKLKWKIATSQKDIFDGTEDWRMAFNLSDEMISDASSLIPLYKSTGKKLTEIK